MSEFECLPEEVIKIGDEITVRVLRVDGKQVTFGINAPKNVGIHRQESFRRAHRNPTAEK